MFNKLGFKTIFTDKHYDYGFVRVMLLDLHDIEHLRIIHSPFAEVYDRVGMNSVHLLGTSL